MEEQSQNGQEKSDNALAVDKDRLSAKKSDTICDVTEVEVTTPSTKGSAGLGIASLLVGLATGAAAYYIGEHWIDPKENIALAITILAFIFSFGTSWLLLAEPGDYLRPIVLSGGVGATIALPSYFLASTLGASGQNLTEFPAAFWYLCAGPLVGYLMIVIAKAALQSKFIPDYSAVFFHGLTVPLIACGAALLAGLALALLFAWATLLNSMGVGFFRELFAESYFVLPFLGAIAGLAVSLMRTQQSVLGALRYILLLFSRIFMAITAVLSVTFLVVIAIKGASPIYDLTFSPAATMTSLAFAGMLIFNGVYQNGEGAPPHPWLRIATLISLIAFPVYSGLAAHALLLRINEYGLTPPRIAAITMAALAFSYSVVCIGGLLSELNWKSKRWMPLVRPLNIVMTFVWVVILLLISSPILNPWAISAVSQEALLQQQKINADDFDFGYLRFKLGKYGDAALERLYNKTSHPETIKIRSEIDRVWAAANYYQFKYSNSAVGIPADDLDNLEDGPMGLELNPEGAVPDEEI